MTFDYSSLLYVLLGTLVLPLIKKWLPDFKLPAKPTPVPTPDPNNPNPAPAPTPDPSGLIASIVDAIFKMLMQRFLPVVEQTVQRQVTEAVANRPPVQEGIHPKVEILPDGRYAIVPPVAK